MREWAVGVIGRYSEVPLGADVKRLLTDSIVLGANIEGFIFGPPFRVTDGRIINDSGLGRVLRLP